MGIFNFHKSSAGATVEFDADGKVAKVTVTPAEWEVKQSGQQRYYTAEASSLLRAAEILTALKDVPGLTYYAVDTPDGMLGRDVFGFYTEGPIKTSKLALETSNPFPEPVESISLRAFGDPMKSQTSVAQLKQAGQYANFVLLMECGHCGYKSPVETQAGSMERQCYCCGATNRTSRGKIKIFLGSEFVDI